MIKSRSSSFLIHRSRRFTPAMACCFDASGLKTAYSSKPDVIYTDTHTQVDRRPRTGQSQMLSAQTDTHTSGLKTAYSSKPDVICTDTHTQVDWRLRTAQSQMLSTQTHTHKWTEDRVQLKARCYVHRQTDTHTHTHTWFECKLHQHKQTGLLS